MTNEEQQRILSAVRTLARYTQPEIITACGRELGFGNVDSINVGAMSEAMGETYQRLWARLQDRSRRATILDFFKKIASYAKEKHGN